MRSNRTLCQCLTSFFSGTQNRLEKRFMACLKPLVHSSVIMAALFVIFTHDAFHVGPSVVQASAPPPTISFVAPTSGPVLGATSVTISGTGFQSGANVLFGTLPATSITVVDSNTITASTPAQGPGMVNVTVTNPDGQAATMASLFLQPNPGFESGLTGWKRSGKSSVSVQTNAANAHSGSNYAELGTLTSTDHPIMYSADATGAIKYYPVRPGDIIDFGGWAYRVAGDGLARWVLVATDANKQNATRIYPTVNNVTTAAWVNQTGRYYVPIGKSYVQFLCELTKTTVASTARFDDANLTISGAFQYTSFVSVSPRAVPVTFNGSVQFVATVTTLTDTNVLWYVDGILGGNASVGTISTSGLYLPPSAEGLHQIEAVSASDSSQAAFAQVTVLNDSGVFTHHYDNARTGQDLHESFLTTANVNVRNFGKLFSYPVDGLIHAQPLYVANVNIGGTYHNVVYVVTEHDSVYAFDADGQQSSPLWKTSFINPGAGISTVPGTDIGATTQTEFGIMATPVIDPVTGTIYVHARTKEGTTYVQRLHALDISTGTEKFNGPVVIQASVPGIGAGTNGTLVPYDPLRQNVRPGLVLLSNGVYFASASISDQQPYHGWVLGYDSSNLQSQVAVYNATPNGSGAGIWQSGGGVAADDTGNLYVITGNGTFSASTGGSDYGDSFLKLGTGSGGISLADYFTPYNQATMAKKDFDLGSGNLVLLPDQSGPNPHLLLGGGKTGTLYLLNRDLMGGFNAGGDQIVQELVGALPATTKNPTVNAGLWTTPTYWQGKIYIWGRTDVLKVFQLNNGLLQTTPIATGTLTSNGSNLLISADSFNNNAILWALQLSGTGALQAYDANNISTQLYSSTAAGKRDAIVIPNFAVPIVANGRVYVGGKNTLYIFGPLP